MTVTEAPVYPTAQMIITAIKSYVAVHDVQVSDWDEFVYEFISDYDCFYPNDSNWYSEAGTDEKDRLRDEVLDLMVY